jgi:hypothetical protein
LAELCAYYSNIAALLAEVSGREEGAGPIRLWPHHFDLARLITLDADGGEDARSIGFGLAPDDGLFGQPYLYVTPWPRARIGRLPEPTAGLRWHDDGYFGLVATAEDIMLGPQAHARTHTALSEAIALCRALLASD